MVDPCHCAENSSGTRILGNQVREDAIFAPWPRKSGVDLHHPTRTTDAVHLIDVAGNTQRANDEAIRGAGFGRERP